MKSLEQLFNKVPEYISDEFSNAFMIEAQNYIAEIKQNFSQINKVDNDVLITTLAELMPDNVEDLGTLMGKIEAVSEHLRFSRGITHDEVELIFSAAITKEAILNNGFDALPLSSQIQSLENRQPLPPEDRQKLNMLDEIEMVVKKIQASYIENKANRLATLIAVLTTLLKESPDYIKYSPMKEGVLLDSLENLQNSYLELIKVREDTKAKDYLEKLKAIDEKADVIASQTITSMCAAMGVRSTSLAQIISSPAHKPIMDDYNRLIELQHVLLQPEGDLRTYYDLTDRFSELFKNIIIKIQNVSYSSETRLSQERERLATEQSLESLPFERYPYIISARNLFKSKNILIVSQKIDLERNTEQESPNLSRFFFPGAAADLKQIVNDAKNNLKIEFKKEPADPDKPGEFRNLLVEKFGEENTILLIAHYDQSIADLISEAVAKSGSSENLTADDSILIIKPEAFAQNLYMVHGIVFREEELHKTLINFAEKQNINRKWYLKSNLKVTSYITNDGFAILHIGTDSTLICNSLMQKSTLNDFKKIIDTILEFEDKFKIRHSALTAQGAKKDDKQELTERIIVDIDSFKKGEITFDELCANIKSFNNEARIFSHSTAVGRVLNLFNTKPPETVKTINDFDSALSKIQESIKNDAKSYLRPPSDAYVDVSRIQTRPRSG